MNKKVLLSLVSLLFLFGGVAAGILLVRQQQTEKKASNPDGTISVSLSPATQDVTVGQNFPVDVMFNPNGLNMGSIQIEYNYTFTGDIPPIEAISITPNADLVNNTTLRYQNEIRDPNSGNYRVGFTYIDSGTLGFTSNTQIRLATINFRVNSEGSINLTLNPESKIYTKAGEDMLMSSSTPGVYSVGVAAPTATLTPMPSATAAPATTPSPSATSAPAATTAPSQTPAPTATTAPGQPTNTPAPTATQAPTSNTSSTSPSATPTRTSTTSNTSTTSLPTAGNVENTLALLALGSLLLGSGFLLRRA